MVQNGAPFRSERCHVNPTTGRNAIKKARQGGLEPTDPRLRRPVLYPTELLPHGSQCAHETNKKREITNFASACLSVVSSRKQSGLVGVRGFEPPTSCSQSKRATGLRYTPRTADITCTPTVGQTPKGRMPLLPSDSRRNTNLCLLYTSPSPRDGLLSRMPSSA